ncbi:MAG: dihydroorotase [Candidatus Omnitrophota bacterium]
MRLLIKNGRVIDPASKIDDTLDILVDNARIANIAKDIKNGSSQVIDASGKIIIPGIVDMHVHLREPGREDKETVLTGTLAALKGGVTSILAMANTNPAMDSPEAIDILNQIIKKNAKANVYICGAITKKRQGQELVNISRLKKSGAIAISDDGFSVDDQVLFSKAIKKAKQDGVLVICHSEDRHLSGAGVMNLGMVSTRLGLKGISKESEYKRVERDINLAKETLGSVHIAHVSCKESVEMIALAKKKGLKITAETAPHYFTLTEEAVSGYNTNMKMNPPLRTKADVQAIINGLRNGTIDAIASDHAPHTVNEKDVEFDRAEFGTIGLETSLSLGITELVDKSILNWPELVKKLCLNPAKILKIDKGTLKLGADADITIISGDKEWTVDKKTLISKSKNSSFLGRKLKGIVEYTICNGNIVYKR